MLHLPLILRFKLEKRISFKNTFFNELLRVQSNFTYIFLHLLNMNDSQVLSNKNFKIILKFWTIHNQLKELVRESQVIALLFL